LDQLSAHLDRGWDLAQRGDAQGAVACAKRALEIDPDSPEVHNLLGYSSALAGESEEALEHYRHAIALDDTYFEAMLNCAELLMNPLGDFDEAIALCDDALEYAETPAEVCDCVLLKVDAFLGKGDIAGAKRAMLELPDDPIDNPAYTFLIGRAYYEMGDAEKAKSLLEDAAKKDPQHPDAHYYVGLVREELGDPKGAVEAFLRARSADLMRAPPAWAPTPETFASTVRRVVSNLDTLLARYVRHAEVYVVDLPGAELVVDGVDPRALMILDAPPVEDDTALPGEPASVYARLFVYQRNVERAAGSAEHIERELQHALEREITTVFLDRDATKITADDKKHLN
jgi:tetratricopeptide (TPR) repeat protein